MKRKVGGYIFFFACLVWLFLSKVNASNLQPLVFLGNRDYAPISFVENGIQKGLLVDIVDGLGAKLGMAVDVRLTEWKKAQDEVASGSADFAGIMGITEERSKIFDFSEPVFDLTYSIFISKGRTGITNIKDLRGLRVGVSAGGLPRTLIEDDSQIQMIVVNNYLDGFREIQRGGLDAVICDTRVGQYIIASNRINNVIPVMDPVAKLDGAFAVKKGNTDILRLINDGLAEMKADGSYEKIISDWKPTSIVIETEKQITTRNQYVLIGGLGLLSLFLFVWGSTMSMEVRRRKEMEKALRESERKAVAIFDSSFGLEGLLSPEGVLLEVNQTALDMIGVNKADVIGRPFEETPWWSFSEDSKKNIREAIEMAKRGVLVHRKAIHYDKGGKAHVVDFTLKPIFGDNNEVVFLIPEGRDITATIEAEKMLKESEGKYRFLFSSMSQGIVIQDLEEKIVEANMAAAEILGLSMDQLMGRTSYDPRWKMIKENGEDFPPDETPSNMVLKTGKPISSVTIGVYIPEIERYKWILVSSVPWYKDGSTKPNLSLTTLTDITGRVDMEKEMKKNEENYKSLFSNMLSGFAFHKIILDDLGNPVDYEFLEMNDKYEELTGLSKEKALGHRVTEVIPGFKNDSFDWIGEFGKIALNGGELVLEKYFSPFNKWYYIQTYSPKKGYFAVTFTDITKSKQTEESLKSVNEHLLMERRKIENILNGISEAVFMTDIDGKISLANKSLERIVNLSGTMLIGKKMDEVLKISIDDGNRNIYDFMRSVSVDSKGEQVEGLFLEKNEGERVRLSGVIYPFIADDKLNGWIWVLKQ